MLTIHQPEITRHGDKSHLSAQIDIDGKVDTLWFEVDSEYEKYLCYERSDSFLAAALPYAMRNKHDITCVAPVTEELAYNLNYHFIPTLAKHGGGWDNLHHVKIISDFVDEEIENCGAVGTGMSCGVDSFHAVANHYYFKSPKDAKPKLTHLCINDAGNFDITGYRKFGVLKVKEAVYERSKKIANDVGLPFVKTDSNVHVFFGKMRYSFIYNLIFFVFAMKKLWKTYFIASGYDYSLFTVKGELGQDSSSYDLLTMTCFSMRNLRLFSEGANLNRVEKTRVVADFPLARKYLHVCVAESHNCGVCGKCCRTLVTLDALDKLELFKNVFPVEFYMTRQNNYFKWLAARVLENNPFAEDIYSLMQSGKYAEVIKQIKDDLEQ